MKALFISKPLIMEPLGLMYLSASAKESGHKTDLIFTSQNIEEKVSEFKPDVIGYSVMTGDSNFYLGLNKNLKLKYNFLSVFGGPHPTFFPEVISQEGVDIVCRGEGEEAFSELLNSLEEGVSLETLSNLYVKNKEGRISRNQLRPLAEIDSIPFPDRHLLKDFSHLKSGPIKHFLASRGCPFSCSYCFNQEYSEIYKDKGKRVRFRSPELVVEEIGQVINASQTKFIYFQDDTFTLNASWLKEFSRLYSQEIKLPFHCHVRPNTINEDKVNILKDAGCYSVHIAAETADDYLRNQILNRGMSKEQVISACNLLKKNNIKFMLQNMIGLPEGSIEKDMDTLELNINCQSDYAWVSIFQPYPGTRLGAYCVEKGFYSGNPDTFDSNFFDSSKMNFSQEYLNQLSNLQKLFGWIVDNPEVHSSGLSKILINSERTPNLIRSYNQMYSEFRKKADARLFGFEL